MTVKFGKGISIIPTHLVDILTYFIIIIHIIITTLYITLVKKFHWMIYYLVTLLLPFSNMWENATIWCEDKMTTKRKKCMGPRGLLCSRFTNIE